MEAAPIAQVASFYNIPVLNVRGVSDHVGEMPLILSRKRSKSISKPFEAVRIIVEHFL